MTVEAIDASLWPGAPSGPAWRLATEHLSVLVFAQGAHLADVRMRGVDEWVPVSVDYPDPSGDGEVGSEPGGFHGATIGRWANRIAGSSYEHEGVTHRLASNEGPNQLHGGPDGFHTRPWRLLEVGADSITLGLHSPHGDQGFPGAADVTARFRVEGGALTMDYRAEADRPTPLNPTNHPYWNLGGTTLDGHLLCVDASEVLIVDDAGIPVAGPPQSVEGTRFDCRSESALAEVVREGGFDHCFVVSEPDPAATQIELRHESGRRLRVGTDQPGVQIYTGQHLDPNRRGIAIETQRFPDGPNRPDFGPSVTRSFRSTTTLHFDNV
ncbi:MAG: aldose epimerase family protein [Actinomycetota bacterium]